MQHSLVQLICDFLGGELDAVSALDAQVKERLLVERQVSVRQWQASCVTHGMRSAGRCETSRSADTKTKLDCKISLGRARYNVRRRG